MSDVPVEVPAAVLPETAFDTAAEPVAAVTPPVLVSFRSTDPEVWAHNFMAEFGENLSSLTYDTMYSWFAGVLDDARHR